MKNKFTDLLKKQKEEPSEENLIALFEALNQISFFIAYNENNDILVGKDKEGKTLIPILTKDSECDQMNADHCERVDFDYVRQLLFHPESSFAGIVINPFSENALIYGEHIAFMDEHMGEDNIETEFSCDNFELVPVERIWPLLRREVSAFGMLHEEINQINLLKGRRSEKDSFHLIFLIVSGGKAVRLFPELANLIRHVVQPGSKFELIHWDDQEIDKIPFNEESLIYNSESNMD